jgi:hypothetical protein
VDAVTLFTASNWKIAVFGREGRHNSMHFHVVGPDFDCSVNLETLEMIVGWAPKKVLKAACAWAAVPANRAALRKAWKDQNP